MGEELKNSRASLAAAFGMLPLAWGIGAGSDMLRPLAIAVIGALCISVLLSLVATPSICYLLIRLAGGTHSLDASSPATGMGANRS